MNEKDCQMLIYLEEELNVTKAAERLYTSQPGLAYRLKQIEDEFAISFFERRGKSTALTAEGSQLVEHAKKQLHLLKETKEIIRSIKEPGSGRLRIGVTQNICNRVFPSLLHSFHQKHPSLNYHVMSGMSSEIFSLLQNGEVDIAVIRGDFSWSEEKHILAYENIGIVHKQKLDLKRLPLYPKISFHEPYYLSRYPNQSKSTIESTVDRWWKEHYTEEPQVIIEVNGYESCVKMADKGLGYAIVPQFFIAPENDLSFTPIKFKDGKEITRKTWVYSRKQKDTIEDLDYFIDFLRENYKKYT